MATMLLFVLIAVAWAAETLTSPGASESTPEMVSEGQSLFNQYCSHCHGPNAVQGERPRDLRRLQRRYGDNWRATFRSTVDRGRPERGMPSWHGTLSNETIAKIGVFLAHVQQ
jgi:polar amino acid transport system substrate-binding protein